MGKAIFSTKVAARPDAHPDAHSPTWERLGDLCETSTGGTPSRGNSELFLGTTPWVKSGELPDGLVTKTEEAISDQAFCRCNVRLLPKGTLLMAMYGATVGKLGILGMQAATNQAVCAITPNSSLDRDYLFYWLLSIRQELIADSFGGAQPNISQSVIRNLSIPIVPTREQRRIAARLRGQFAEVTKARAAVQARLDTSNLLIYAILCGTLANGRAKPTRIADCLTEVTDGIGPEWSQYPVLGATRAGLALAKEPVGKNPGRYKPVRRGTVFYNPMRILLGSIAMLDEDDAPGITSPDYVVMNAVENQLSPRWFYHWFRSSDGAEFIKSMTRGAVRERLMFRRLAPATIQLPDWTAQQAADRQFAEIKRTQKILTGQLTTLDHLPAALLREAFNGRV